jgi:hypothetical protein
MCPAMADQPKDGSNKDELPTQRDLKPPTVSSDTVPDVFGQYVPPRPLPEVSRHRTLDLKSVRLSDEADPRRAPTELRLQSPAREARRGFPIWLLLVIVGLIGVSAWAFLPSSAPAAAPGQAPAAPPAKEEPARPVVTTEAAKKAAPPVPSAAPAPVSSNATVSSAAAPLPKPARPGSETAKKRRDPWLE